MLNPLVVGEFVLAEGGEGFGERHVVIVQTLIAEPWIAAEIVVLLEPGDGCFDTVIVGGQPRVDHALKTGVGHRGVAAQAAGRFVLAGLAVAAGGGRVVEAAVVNLGGEGRGVVRAFEILANLAIDVDAIEQARKEPPKKRKGL